VPILSRRIVRREGWETTKVRIEIGLAELFSTASLISWRNLGCISDEQQRHSVDFVYSEKCKLAMGAHEPDAARQQLEYLR
jgi:hypothetical protein